MAVKTTQDLEVLAYRLTPDPDNELRNKLISRYVKLTKAIAARFVCRRHDYDDLTEYALYQLVLTICRAKLNLKDNNLEPYVVRTVKNRLVRYVTFDHLITVPGGSNSAWGTKPVRRDLDDVVCCQADQADEVMLTEIMTKCIESEEQEQVVRLRLAGFTFLEIARKMDIPRGHVQRLWYTFQREMEGHYAL